MKATTQRQNSIIQQISNHAAEGRPRLPVLDDQLDELEAAREKLAKELTAEEAPVEDFSGKVEKLKAQFNPANMEIIIRKPIYLAAIIPTNTPSSG
nr:Site-specific recombinase and resolvase superfamily protein [Rhizobium sp. Q54]